MEVHTKVGLAGLRDICPEDVDSIVRFWYESGDEFLAFSESIGLVSVLVRTRDNGSSGLSPQATVISRTWPSRLSCMAGLRAIRF
jgi:hypothetical protein